MRNGFVLIALLAVLLVGAAFAQKPGSYSGSQASQERSPFRYIIVADASPVQKSVNDNRYNYYFDVLMDDRALTEENLVTLFRLMSKRFGDREGLSVNVYTSMEAIRTPEEFDRQDLWGPVDDYRKFKYAFYNRTATFEEFRYGIPGIVKDKTVRMKR